MDRYCVVISGLQDGVEESDAAWAPIAAAFKLDAADFSQRILAVLPLMVRRDLDQPAAEKIVQQLRARGVEAVAVRDDKQFVYIMRDLVVRGPLPFSALDMFLREGEYYRMDGDGDWRRRVEELPDLDVPQPSSVATRSNKNENPPLLASINNRSLPPRVVARQQSIIEARKKTRRRLIIFAVVMAVFLAIAVRVGTGGHDTNADRSDGSQVDTQGSSATLTTGSEPVDIEVQIETFNISSNDYIPASYNVVRVVAKVDRVVIKNVVINRGRCSIPNGSARLPGYMEFGQTLRIAMAGTGCNVIEVSVDTDQGTWTRSFQ